MSGYIGSKAVLLSTTAAVVTGNSTVGGNLTVDTNTLFVDAANNRVGVGTSSPLGKLSVNSATGQAGFHAGTSVSPERGNLWYDTDGTGWTFNIGKLQSGTFTPQMTLQDNGNVGIGVSSPSAALDVLGASGDQLRLRTAGTEEYKIGRNASTGLLDFYGTQTGYTGYTFGGVDGERMRIDSSGRVGIGTSSPEAKLNVVSGDTLVAVINGTNANGGYMAWRQNGTVIADIGTSQQIFGTGGTDTFGINGRGARSLLFGTNNTERMRIDSSGRVGINNTSFGDSQLAVTANAGGTFAGTFVATSANSYGISIGADSGALAYFYADGSRAGAPVGSITENGTSTAYNTSSDYRLKENVVQLTGAADRLAQIPVHRFNFIADPDRTVDGFLAHEVQEFVPECVTGTKDQVETVEVTDEDGNVTTETRPVYQGIDQSKLVPLLTAALQEALTKIDALEARIVTLEGGAA